MRGVAPILAEGGRRRGFASALASGCSDAGAMVAVAEAGAIVMPPFPAFYTKRSSVKEIIDPIVGRALDLFDLEAGLVSRWPGTARSSEQD